MSWKKIGNALLFPHLAVMILLVPVSTVWVVYALVCLESASPLAIASYVVSAYTLTVWCVRIPDLIRLAKRIKEDNRHVRRLTEDARLRVNLSLHGSLAWNMAYAAFQLWLGVVHHSFWFGSLACYYICLAVMRFFLARHTRTHRAGEDMKLELRKYRACGWVFLFMNLALTLMVFFMLYWNRTFTHHEITTIAMAAFTFTAFTVAIVNVVKYRRYNSPVYSASKAISFAAACVSMLTLSSTMLTTFNDGTMGEFEHKLLLGMVGVAVSAVVVTMAVYMIIQGNRRLKEPEAQAISENSSQRS